MLSRLAAVVEAWDWELPRMAGVVAVVWQLAMLVQVLAYLGDYRQPLVPVAMWVGLLAAAGWLVPRSWVGGLSGRDSATAIAIAVTVVAVLGLGRRTQVGAGPVDWSILGVGWLFALIAVSRRTWVWAWGAILVFAVHAVVIARVLGVTALSMARLAATAYTLVVILTVFAALRPALRANAASAARGAALASRAAAERAAGAAIVRDREKRLALLEGEALPLLRGIADGTLDPRDRAVRERCARSGAALRRALADAERGGGGLMGQLAPALEEAKARGLPTEVQVIGDPGSPIREVAAATAAAVGGVMSALPPHPVTLTVVESGTEVELFVTFDRPPVSAVDVRGLGRSVPEQADWDARLDLDDVGTGCLQVRWRKASAA